VEGHDPATLGLLCLEIRELLRKCRGLRLQSVGALCRRLGFLRLPLELRLAGRERLPASLRQLARPLRLALACLEQHLATRRLALLELSAAAPFGGLLLHDLCVAQRDLPAGLDDYEIFAILVGLLGSRERARRLLVAVLRHLACERILLDLADGLAGLVERLDALGQ